MVLREFVLVQASHLVAPETIGLPACPFPRDDVCVPEVRCVCQSKVTSL